MVSKHGAEDKRGKRVTRGKAVWREVDNNKGAMLRSTKRWEFRTAVNACEWKQLGSERLSAKWYKEMKGSAREIKIYTSKNPASNANTGKTSGK